MALATDYAIIPAYLTQVVTVLEPDGVTITQVDPQSAGVLVPADRDPRAACRYPSSPGRGGSGEQTAGN